MIIIDLLGEELGLRQSNLAQFRIVRLQDSLAHVGGLEDRAIFVEESLVVSKMVGIDYFAMSVFKPMEGPSMTQLTFKVVADPWKTLRARYFANRVPTDCDTDRLF
jgi:hypothetical protein